MSGYASAFRKPAEAVHKPFGGEVRRCTYGQNTRGLALQEALRANRDPIERVANDGEVVATSLRDHQPLAFTME
jgi:hypothetical protein